MVRSSFPGKPAKYFTRKKCSSSVNNLDVEGFTVAEELIKSLGVFESLFQDSVEDSSFHGFTNADINRARKRADLKNLLKPSKCRNDSSKLIKKKAESAEPSQSEGDETNSGGGTSLDGSSDRSAPCNSECINPAKDNVASKEGDATTWSNNALSGKFVLPSRSAHSSRVIKPNKRFFPNEQNSVVHKKSRTDGVVLQSSDRVVDTVSPCKAKMDQDSSMSPATKVILRKPKLNLKSEPFPAFDGPFSSSSSSSLGAQDSKNRRRPSTKVVCGVCGSVRLYKNLQHARKFGIFSCELCRKFIVKILKLDREGNIQQFSCSSGNGTCQIRQSALEVNTFPTVMKKSISKSHITERCQACWLYVSLRSFRLPKEILQRLNRYLPDSFAGKIDYIKNRSQSPSSSSWYSGSEDIGSGSSALTCVTATKRVVKNKASKQVQCRKGEVKNYENLSRGPRIKHVCRSALQVLGQTPATFPEKKSNKVADEPLKEKKTKTDKLPPSKNNSKSRSNSVESLVEPLVEASPAESIDDDCDLNSSQPVARMLQDLGRCNNELLDWAEGLGDGDRHLARVTLDYWQPYDPDEALITGFPLLAPNPICIPSVCFLCGSAGQHKLLRCLVCCEPYHTFCVPNFRFIKDPSSEMTVKWACPKCTQCVVCSELGGSQQSCNKCRKSYHAFCLPGSARFNSTDALWTCPTCLCCKSCNGTVVDLFLGNIPLCKSCFRQRKKGNFCPLCQRCYDENDYSTKMMECGKCKCWVHADCEGLTEEKYQILSYLPPQIEFICRMCCTNPPSSWSLAIEEELKAGYLKVFKILTKNRAICSMIKSTPKKVTCSQCSTRQIRPIPIKDEFTSNFKYSNTNSTSLSSVKCLDSGLLTPTFTRDDENILKDSKTNFPGFVDDKLSCGRTGKIIRCSNPSVMENEVKTTGSENSGLSIRDLSDDKSGSSVSATDKCTCEINDNSKPSMNLMSIKNKAASNEYLSVAEFHRDVDKVMGELSFMDLRKAYLKALKIAFPWFKVDAASLPVEADIVSSSKNLSKVNCVSEVKITNSPERHKVLVNIDAGPQKIDFEEAFDDKRICLLCKTVGEGAASKEERLLYCGNSEWVHANCALWSSEVFEEIDGSLQNVQSAVSRSRHLRCSVCGQKGASVGCCAKSCSMAFHFSCAVDSNCVLLESKEVYCKNHGHLSESKDLQRDFSISRSIYVELDRRKKKGVPKDWAKLLVGTLYIDNFGEVRPEVSDKADLILPIDFSCSRLFWSSTNPLKMIKYFIKTKLIKSEVEYSPENDINYTIDHSLDFTPPPSPIEDFSRKTKIVDDKDIRAVLNQLIETVCVKEEEINLVDQQGPDLLPPEIKDAIFEDLPHDLLAGICMQDIFPKMLNCDYFVSGEASCKSDKLDPHSSRNSPVEDLDRNQSNDIVLKRSIGETYKNKYASFPRVDERKQVNLQCRLRSSVNITGRTNQEMSIKPSKGNWKKGEIIQVDGQFDSSESESDNSSDNEGDNSIVNNYNESKDKPVKCSRCHRTYRSNLGFTRHLPSCTVESSCSDSESSQDSKENYSGIATTEEVNSPNEKTEGEIEITYNCQIVNGATEQTISVEEVRDTSTERIEVVQNTSNVEYSVGLVEGNYTVKQLHDCQLMQGFQPAHAGTSSQTLVIQQLPEPVSYVNQFPAIQPPPSIQYVQDTSPIITSQFLPGYQLQSPIAHQTVVQNVPTMLGTVVANHQPMILTNQSAIGSYAAPPAALVIANQPVFVNMETVVSNTIMSSSQLISSSSVSGILETNSFSTTTQVYHSAKPPVEIPQSYVVVNGGPQVMDNHNPCPVQVTQTSGILQQANTNPWATNYQVNYQESYKMDKNVSFPALSKEILCEDKKVACKPTINTREPAIIDPLGIHDKQDQFNRSCFSSGGTSNSKSSVAIQPCTSRVTVPPLLNKIKPNQVKKVDLPESSAVGKEKPQQAVAPVVVRSVPSYLNKKPTPTLVSNSYRNQRLNKPQPVLNKSEGIQTDINTHLKKDSPRPLHEETIKPIQQSSASDKLNCKDKPVIEKPVDADKPALSEKPVAPIRSPSPEKVKQVHSENQKVKNGFKNGLDPKLKEAFSVSKIEKSKGGEPLVEPKKSVEKEKKIPVDTGQQAVKLTSNKPNGISKLKPESIAGPKVSYEITSEDGFSYTTDNIVDAWNKVFIKVQEARASKGLEPLPQNPYTDRNAALKGLMGLGTNSVKFILEQLPGASRCMKYTPSFHKRQMSVAEKLMTSYRENRSGCARSEPLTKGPKSYDMFNWLASRHRRPPSLLDPHADVSNGNSRRGNLNLPMAMRFRHLKETSKKSVGVFRSDIHGRGLFCLRNIDNGEMIIEYAGELIRSSLTDTRERYYTARGMGCYMFRIDDKYVVDATMKGNAARFINHSCEPNCYSRIVEILGKKHILIFALRRIKQGEELTYDYKFPLEDDKISCHCLSRKCRKYLN